MFLVLLVLPDRHPSTSSLVYKFERDFVVKPSVGNLVTTGNL